MQLGIFMQPVHDPARDLTEVLQQDRETILLADRLGYSECWIGEHITATVEPITSPLVFLASLIDGTRQIKLGTGVFCLAQKHPAIIAAEAALFDHLCKGRFNMGIGPGGLSSDLELFGAQDPTVRAERTLESIDMILKIWAQEPPYNLRGKHYSVTIADMSRKEFGVGCIPKPYQRPHPPLAVSLMSPESANARIAGERGWIPLSGAAFVQPRYIRSHWEQFSRGAAAAGRSANRAIWRVCRSIMVFPSDTEADDYITNPKGPFNFYFRYVMSSFGQRNMLHLVRPDGREQDASVSWLDIARSQVAHGSPARVLDQHVHLHERLGGFGVLVAIAHEWDDPAVCRRSMELLATQVMPKLSQHAASLRQVAE